MQLQHLLQDSLVTWNQDFVFESKGTKRAKFSQLRIEQATLVLIGVF